MNKIRFSPIKMGLMSIALLILGGCATEPVQPPAPVQTALPAPPPPPPAKRAGELALAEGVDLYNQGNYPAAIKKLQESAEIWSETTLIRVEALKYLAFSSCVLKQRTQCRQFFDRLLEADQSFDLAPAEMGHPDWSPVFRQAKQALSNPTRRPAAVNPPTTR
jgi:tetratricopeptide (TPR) repeat protein